MQQQQPQKNVFLFVMSIIMIVSGGIMIIVEIFVNLIGALGAYVGAGGKILAGGILGILGAVAQLVAGIIGLGASKNPAKTMSAIVWGILCLVLSAISLIILGGSAGTIIGSIALPVVFLVAAFLNKKNA